MDRARYEQYLSLFNTQDYDGILDFWAPKFSCMMGTDELFSTPEGLKKFYSFMHDHVKEEIFIDHYLADDTRVFAEARVRITGKKAMTAEAIAEAGFTTLLPIEQGTVIDIPQFIHYHLVDGRFATATCLIAGIPAVSTI